MILALRLVALVGVAAFVQVSSLAGVEVRSVAPDVVLVVVLLVAWERGALTGAFAGFLAGLFVDVVTLGNLGVSSLLLTLAGYWAGRYGETTGAGRRYAPYLATFVLTVAYGIAGYALHSVLGDGTDASAIFGPLLPTALLNTVIALLLRRLCRAALGVGPRRPEPPLEVESLG